MGISSRSHYRAANSKRMRRIILNMPNTDESSAKHKSVLDNKKNNDGKVSIK